MLVYLYILVGIISFFVGIFIGKYLKQRELLQLQRSGYLKIYVGSDVPKVLPPAHDNRKGKWANYLVKKEMDE